MSLADLPIENIAHIQGYLASNIAKFDTCLLRACRAIREKALAYTWPPLHIHDITAHMAAVVCTYKFAKIYMFKTEAGRFVLNSLKPDLNVELLLKEVNDRLEHKYVENGRVMWAVNAHCVATETVVVTSPTSLTIVGSNFAIDSKAEYDLTIIAIGNYHTVRVRLSGVLPTWIKWRSAVDSPYMYFKAAHAGSYTTSKAFIQNCIGNPMTVMCAKQHCFDPAKSNGTLKELPHRYKGILGNLMPRSTVYDIMNRTYSKVYGESDISAVVGWLTTGTEQLHVPTFVDIEDMVNTVRVEYIKMINEACAV